MGMRASFQEKCMIAQTTDAELREVTFDRPESRNALTPAALEELQAAFDEAEEPVVYLSGRGSAFCAGADLDVVRGLDAASARDLAAAGQRLARTIETYDGVVVAGVDGPARGGGVELALACDLRIGTEAATFAESGVTHGLFGAWGGTARLPDVVGPGMAMDMALTGRVLDAAAARQCGLLSRVVEDPGAVARSLLDADPAALRTIRRRIADDGDLAEQEAAEVSAFSDLVERRNR